MIPTVGQYGSEAYTSLVTITGNDGVPIHDVLMALPSTAVTILNPDTTPAFLYSSLAGTTGGSTAPFNPVNTDANGNLLFYATPGQYLTSVGGVLGPPITVAPPGSAVAAIQQIVVGPTRINVGGFSGFDASGGTDCAGAINAALAAGYVIDGPPGVYAIGSNIAVADGKNLQFGGGGTNTTKVRFKCLTAASGITFGDLNNPTTASAGGRQEGFVIDGNNIALVPLAIGCGGYRHFDCIVVLNGADANVLLFGTQNCTFTNLVSSGAANDALRLDRAASNYFINPELTFFGKYGVNFMSGGPAINQGGALTATYPTNNVFNGGRIEIAKSAAVAGVFHSAGLNNTFSDFNFADTHVPDLVKITQSGVPFSDLLRFRDCTFLGSSTCNVFNIDANTRLLGGGTNLVTTALNCFYLQSGVNEFSDLDNLILTLVTNPFAGPGNSAFIRVRPRINQPISGSIGATVTESFPVYDTLSGALDGYLGART